MGGLSRVGITNFMPESQLLEEALRDLILDLCRVLHTYGYQEISVGALMRVIGVAEERAADHDAEVIDLVEHFAKTAPPHANVQVPPGTVFH